jgi:opacity protein-like surface antigen
MFALPSPDPGIEVIASSQGMSKGLRQTEGVQILVRPEVAIGPLFVGALYKNVTSATADGEAAFVVGLRQRLAGFDLAVSTAYKWNTGARMQADRDCLEFNATASRRFGRVTPRISLTYSPDDLGGTRASLYAEAGASVSLFAGASVSANVARRSRDGGPDYTAFNAGATYAITSNLSADLRYFDTAQSRLGEIYEPRLVASARLHF